eukprot:TRINITY_DN15093_c0_g3_i4.p1 TRINITY_DN15093_c0_g3~~TRINITY_DN15093_c0_g3_i4.p1  ORF type:complete len:522 (-),score=30.80 TRINITY_DN15093_c0_g3_i4:71-1636(-)
MRCGNLLSCRDLCRVSFQFYVLAALGRVFGRAPQLEEKHPSWLLEKLGNDFQSFVDANNYSQTMTQSEITLYRKRFIAKGLHRAYALDACAADHETKVCSSSWNQAKYDILHATAPVATMHSIKRVNRKRSAWTAQMYGWLPDLSFGDASRMMGYLRTPSEKKLRARTEDSALHDLDVDGNDSLLLQSFDSRDKWSHCRDVISHVRDQGLCGSCWAVAAATSMDGRLCIATGGQFRGPNAWVSAGYMTSCFAPSQDGCEGGSPIMALQNALGGVPTGSEHEARTCVPYFGSGDSLKHFEDGKVMKAPACPAMCTGAYSRTLSKDRFYTTGWPLDFSSFAKAQQVLVEGGPIPMGFTVYEDLFMYSKGYYTPGTSSQVGDHSTTLIGWESYSGEAFLLSINSWGTQWGNRGLFLMNRSCCDVRYFSFEVSSQQESLPLPSGSDASRQVGSKANHRSRYSARDIEVQSDTIDMQRFVGRDVSTLVACCCLAFLITLLLIGRLCVRRHSKPMLPPSDSDSEPAE